MNGRECLLAFVRARFPEIGYQKRPVCSSKCGFQCFRTIQVRQHDFVSQLWMLGRMACQRAYHCAALMTGCADDDDELFGVWHGSSPMNSFGSDASLQTEGEFSAPAST